jgi:hypothetical protein
MKKVQKDLKQQKMASERGGFRSELPGWKYFTLCDWINLFVMKVDIVH